MGNWLEEMVITRQDGGRRPQYHSFFPITKSEEEAMDAKSSETRVESPPAMRTQAEEEGQEDEAHSNRLNLDLELGLPAYRGGASVDVHNDEGHEGASSTAASPPPEFLFRKRLMQSDVNRLCRLAISKELAERCIVHKCSPEAQAAIRDDGLVFCIRDSDTRSNHSLRFRLWKSNKTYVFTSGWIAFVRRRRLKPNDVINFWWENTRPAGRFCISVDRHSGSSSSFSINHTRLPAPPLSFSFVSSSSQSRMTI